MRIEAWTLMRLSDENFMLIRCWPTEGGECSSVRTYLKYEVEQHQEINELFGVTEVQKVLNGDL